MRKPSRYFPALAVCVALCVAGTSAFGVNVTVTQGTICTNPGSAPIKDSDLSKWINQFIPASTQRLLVLTECYGGNTASAFVGQANTAVISATIPGQQARYGGYDSGSSAALAPGAGNTGATVHAGGVATKSPKETPSQLGDGNGGTPNTGNLNPANFSLAPVDPVNGPVKSRHVLVYAGQPGGPNNNDVNQRNTITNNFNGKPGTSVTSVGDNGMNGWGGPATAAGLQTALKNIGNAIAASPDPSKEQFIMFITDHGDLNKTQNRTVQVQPGIRKSVTDNTDSSNNPSTNTNLQCFQTSQFVDNPLTVLSSQTTAGGFSVSIDLSNETGGNGLPLNQSQLFLAFSSWTLDAVIQTGPQTGTDITLSNPQILTTDLDGNGVTGDTAGEGVTLEFPVSPGFMVSSFFDVFTELDITPSGPIVPSSGSWLVSNPSEDTGEIPKDVPEPASLGVLAIGLLGLTRRRT